MIIARGYLGKGICHACQGLVKVNSLSLPRARHLHEPQAQPERICSGWNTLDSHSRSKSGNDARTHGIFKKDEAVIGQLHDLLKSDRLEPLLLKSVGRFIIACGERVANCGEVVKKVGVNRLLRIKLIGMLLK